MAVIGYTALFMLIALVTLFVIMVKHNKPVPPEDHDESEWYDENGNHIYYDRKLIRYLEQKTRQSDPCTRKQTGESETKNLSLYREDTVIKEERQSTNRKEGYLKY